jgi:hypothetical protein
MRKLLIAVLCFVCVAQGTVFADEVWMPKPDPAPSAPPPLLTPEQAAKESARKHKLSVTGGALLGVGGTMGLIAIALTVTSILGSFGCSFSDTGQCASSAETTSLNIQEGFAIGFGVAATATVIAGAVLAAKGRGWNNPVLNTMSISAAPIMNAGRTDGGTVGVSIRF